MGAIGGTIIRTMATRRRDFESVTALKTGAAKLLRTVNETRRPLVITQSGEPKGVLLDFESYEELREATVLLKLIAQGEADARTGRVHPQDDVFAAARTRLSAR
jgi:prevent-host-death family protein